jgi:outer membrane protein assembly factor BamB
LTAALIRSQNGGCTSQSQVTTNDLPGGAKKKKIHPVPAYFLKRGFVLAAGVLAAVNGPAQTPAPTLLWQRPLGLYCDSAPALADDGTLYVTTWNGKLFALSPSGRTRWSFACGAANVSTPAIGEDGTVYFGSRDRFFYAVDPAGRLKWRFATGGWVDSSPAIADDGTVCFGSWDKTFYALRPDGTKKWEFKAGEAIVSSPAIAADGTIYFGADDKKFYALHPDGTKKWEFKTGGEIITSPAIAADGTVCFKSLDGILHALNPDGAEKWRLKTGSINRSSPVIDQAGMIYIGVYSGVWKIDPGGKVKGHFDGRDAVEGTPALAEDGTVYFSDVAGYVQACHDSGGRLWEFYTGMFITATPAIGTTGNVYVGNNENKFFAFEGVSPPAKSAWPMFRHDPHHTGRVSGK